MGLSGECKNCHAKINSWSLKEHDGLCEVCWNKKYWKEAKLKSKQKHKQEPENHES